MSRSFNTDLGTRANAHRVTEHYGTSNVHKDHIVRDAMGTERLMSEMNNGTWKPVRTYRVVGFIFGHPPLTHRWDIVKGDWHSTPSGKLMLERVN